jgi:hypothetical protein
MPRATKVQGSNVKKEKKTRVKKVKEPKVKPEFNDRQIWKMNELYELYKVTLLRYLVIKDDEDKLNNFCSIFRSPIFDLSFLKTRLISEAAKLVPYNMRAKDHYYNRTLSSKFIFRDMDLNRDMTFEEFVVMIKKYGSTIIITKEEHARFKKDAQGMYLKTYRDYEDRGVDVPGLREYSESHGH